MRQESDSLGTVDMPEDALWGAQTQRALQNFAIGEQRFKQEFLHAFALVKKAAALTNAELDLLAPSLSKLICQACDEIMAGQHKQQFPLVIWQTGSGTQTNMNFNEVIANRANEMAGHPRGSKSPVHPNDHVNLSQSSNDVFPSVMHVCLSLQLKQRLLPSLLALQQSLEKKSYAFRDMIKIGRTHLMDAAPITLGQEFSAYVSQLNDAYRRLEESRQALQTLAMGGSAVGTGLNTHPDWADYVARQISKLSGQVFTSAENKFMALACHDVLVDVHSRLRGLAVALFKISNDLRLLASGPRCGLGELSLPANEPGSSIMPGKVNPTQVEALTMVVAQVMGNDVTVGFAGSQGHLELNVYKPVIIHNIMESVDLLADAMDSFNQHCVIGIKVNQEQLAKNTHQSLMLVTALNPVIGYDKAAAVAKLAWEKNISLKAAALELNYLSAEAFEQIVDPKKMLSPTEKKSGQV